MLDDANMRFDYLVIDGNTDLNNPISSLGMTEADKLLCCSSSVCKGLFVA